MPWSIVAAAASIVAFLVGLNVMREGLGDMAKGRLPKLLKTLVRTPGRGIATGAIVTSLLQSSAAVTAICVAMVAGGTMPFRHALGVVLGANVGSTVTPQLLTLDLWGIAVPALATGAVLVLLRRSRLRAPGLALSGFGTVFLSLQTLTATLEPLSRTPRFMHWLQWASAVPWLAALAGCVASAVIQSSTATTVITMALCKEHLVSVPSAIAIVLGANVGTCVTAVLAAVGQSRPAMQVALAHVLLNVAGVIVVLPWLDRFCRLVAAFGEDAAQQIANAHTLFNVASTLAVWPVTRYYARLIEWLLPDEGRT
jgi:phosphate:Na+ symporter